MKVFVTVMKVLAALAVVAGIVYVIVTYGDKIVAWTRNLLNRCTCFFTGSCCEEVSVEEDQAMDCDFEG